MRKELTVLDIKKAIEGLPDSMEITFGSTKNTRRPLRFYRFKSRGDDLLQIELSEMDPDYFSNEAEVDDRITVGQMREEFRKFWKDSDTVIFGGASDCAELFSRGPSVVFSFELDQE